MAERNQPGLAARLWNGVGDPWVLISTLCLTAMGLLMVYSASSVLATKRYLDETYFFKLQAARVGLGLLAMAVLAKVDYASLRKLAYPALGVVLFALILVLIPGIGHRAGGAARWLYLGGVSFQPSEYAKLALVIYLAYSMASHQEQVKSISKGLVPHMGIAALITLPVLVEPDLGTSVILAALTLAMLFAGGVRVTYLFIIAVATCGLLYLVIDLVPHWGNRLQIFWDPWADPQNSGFQIIHSFQALGSGGLLGSGLGASVQKLFYLPEPHTDFIFAVLGEELGLWGVSLVLGLFTSLIWRGLRTSLDARDLFGTFLALGATLIIGLQAFINIAVVMGVLPTTGLALPFISYGGSSLITNLACVGIILSVAGHREKAR